VSTTNLAPTLEQFLGSSQGVSPADIQRLTAKRQDEAQELSKRDLSGVGDM